MKDLRRFSREVVYVDCNIYVANSFEFPAKLLNLSEAGVFIELDFSDELYSLLKLGDYIKFQCLDYIGNKEEGFVFQELAKIIRIEKLDSKLKIACEVSMHDIKYSNYIGALKRFRHLDI